MNTDENMVSLYLHVMPRRLSVCLGYKRLAYRLFVVMICV